MNELVAENQRARAAAEEAERNAAIRAELQKLGIVKIDLAYKAVKDDIYRSEDGRLLAQGGAELRDYLDAVRGGESGTAAGAACGRIGGERAGERDGEAGGGLDISRIRPGMMREEMDRVRQEMARVASQHAAGNLVLVQ